MVQREPVTGHLESVEESVSVLKLTNGLDASEEFVPMGPDKSTLGI